TFAPLEVAKSITVPLLNDQLREGDERFLIRLLNPSPGLALGNAHVAEVKTAENASAFEFVQPAVSVSEDAGNIMISVRRGSDLGQPVSVNFATRDQTGGAGLDCTRWS